MRPLFLPYFLPCSPRGSHQNSRKVTSLVWSPPSTAEQESRPSRGLTPSTFYDPPLLTRLPQTCLFPLALALAVPLRRPLFCQTATWLTPSLCSLPSKATLSEMPLSLIPESMLGTPPPGHSPAPGPLRLLCLCNKTPPIRWPPTAIWHAREHGQGPVGRVCQLRDAATGSGVRKTQAGGWNLPEACFPTHQVVDAGSPLKHPPVASPCGLGFPEHDGWVPGMGTPTDRHRATSASVQSHAAVTTQPRRSPGAPPATVPFQERSR